MWVWHDGWVVWGEKCRGVEMRGQVLILRLFAVVLGHL